MLLLITNHNSLITYSVMTPAAVAAGTAVEIFGARDPAQFQRLVDIAVDGLLDLVQFLLRIEKASSDRVVEQRFAIPFERVDFFAGQLLGHLLLLLERLTLVQDTVILVTGLFVPHKRIDALANRLHVGF